MRMRRRRAHSWIDGAGRSTPLATTRRARILPEAHLIRGYGAMRRTGGDGMAQIAAETKLGRESLYKALAPGAKPRYDTILKVTRALGVRLTTVPG